MTDKEKIREEVQRLMNELIQEKQKGYGSDVDDACILELQNVLTYIDSLQEESSETSNVWFDARNSVPEDSTNQIICIKEDGLAVATVGKIVSGTTKWAYLGALLQVVNKETYKGLSENQCRKLIDTAFELGKEAIKDKPVSEDLEEEINKYISDNFFGSETMGFFAARTKEEPNDIDIALCAKHFFELGMAVSNKAQKGE